MGDLAVLEKLENAASLYLLLKSDPDANSHKLGRHLSTLPGVEEVYMTVGEWSFIIKLSSKNLERKSKLCMKRLRSLQQIKEVKKLVGAKKYSKRG